MNHEEFLKVAIEQAKKSLKEGLTFYFSIFFRSIQIQKLNC
jgi:hypothetical protein